MQNIEILLDFLSLFRIKKEDSAIYSHCLPYRNLTNMLNVSAIILRIVITMTPPSNSIVSESNNMFYDLNTILKANHSLVAVQKMVQRYRQPRHFPHFCRKYSYFNNLF